MSVTNCILYIKGDQNTEVKTHDVTLGDILTMECTRQSIVSKLKTVKVLKIPQKGQHRFVVSILKIIEEIHKEYPNLEVQNLGAPDLIITYEGEKKDQTLLRWIKIFLVVLTTFIGAGFAIMTFNNDGGVSEIFEQLYEQFLGQKQEGAGILEFAYSAGLSIGILVFFNHFGKKRFSVDPTPIEVEMRLYENDIQTTLVQDYSRKERELDVGQTSNTGNHRS